MRNAILFTLAIVTGCQNPSNLDVPNKQLQAHLAQKPCAKADAVSTAAPIAPAVAQK